MSGKRQPLKEGSGIAEQLRELRGLTGMTGAVHDAQIQNLKFWGWGVFQHVNHKELTIGVDTDAKDVKYSWAKAGKPGKKFPQFLAALVAGIREMFGPEWRLLVEERGKLLYQSKRLVTPKKAADERKQGLRDEVERIGEEVRARRRKDGAGPGSGPDGA